MKSKDVFPQAISANIIALTFAGDLAFSSVSFAGDLSEIKPPGDRAYPESLAAAPDGTLQREQPSGGGCVAHQDTFANGELFRASK